jgi:hypothetical protein
MVRFQTNCVLKYTKVPCKRKIWIWVKKFKDQSLAKKSINKLMVIGYRLRISIMLENKQRQKHKFNISNSLFVIYIKQ